jgi:hypothetical protein
MSGSLAPPPLFAFAFAFAFPLFERSFLFQQNPSSFFSFLFFFSAKVALLLLV